MPLLRRAIALLLPLSVMLTALGGTHVRCSEADHGQSAPTTMAGMEHGTSGEALPAQRDHCEHGSGAPNEQGTAPSCQLVVHCASVMMAADRPSVASGAAMHGEGASRQLAAPVARTLEPDSPPPRA